MPEARKTIGSDLQLLPAGVALMALLRLCSWHSAHGVRHPDLGIYRCASKSPFRSVERRSLLTDSWMVLQTPLTIRSRAPLMHTPACLNLHRQVPLAEGLIHSVRNIKPVLLAQTRAHGPLIGTASASPSEEITPTRTGKCCPSPWTMSFHLPSCSLFPDIDINYLNSLSCWVS